MIFIYPFLYERKREKELEDARTPSAVPLYIDIMPHIPLPKKEQEWEDTNIIIIQL